MEAEREKLWHFPHCFRTERTKWFTFSFNFENEYKKIKVKEVEGLSLSPISIMAFSSSLSREKLYKLNFDPLWKKIEKALKTLQ